MCIFCERAKASLDDPLAGLDGDVAWGGAGAESSFGRARNKSSSNTASKARNKGWEATLRQKREAERCEELRRQARLPVTVITGFLGAGKTTFVNHLLSARHGRRLAVIENEFGEVAVDDALLGDGGVERAEEAQQVILMPNGCMCCRVRGDLVDALKRLIASASGIEVPENTESTLPNGASEEAVGGAGENSTVAVSGEKIAATSVDASSRVSLAKEEQERGKLDGIVLECSGLDELAPVLQTFFADPFVQEHVRLDAVVCLCDSPRLLRTLVVPSVNTPLGNTAAGDSTTNKGDCSAAKGDKKYVKSAKNVDEKTSDSSAALVMSQLALSDRVLLNKSDLISPEEGGALVEAVKEHFPGTSVTRCERGKVDVDLVLGVDSFSLDRALEMDQQFADMLADRPADSKKRDHHHGKEQKHGGKKHVEDAALGHPHEHERLGAQSVGVELAEGPIDWAKFTSWLKGFLEKEGELIWRLKGVLWTTAPGGEYSSTPAWGLGSGKRTVVQGLYGHFESEVSEWPVGVTRRSRMVFIGALPPRVQEALRAGVHSCVAPPRQRPPPPARPQKSTQLEAGRVGGAFASRLGSVKFGGGEDDLFL